MANREMQCILCGLSFSMLRQYLRHLTTKRHTDMVCVQTLACQDGLDSDHESAELQRLGGVAVPVNEQYTSEIPKRQHDNSGLSSSTCLQTNSSEPFEDNCVGQTFQETECTALDSLLNDDQAAGYKSEGRCIVWNIGCQCNYVQKTKVKEGNLERQVIWNSQAKSSINHKLHPLILICIVSMKGEFGSSKDGLET